MKRCSCTHSQHLHNSYSCIFCVHYCLFNISSCIYFWLTIAWNAIKYCIIVLKASGQNGALFGGLGRRTGAPNWVKLCWLQNGALDRRLGTAKMVAEKGPEQWIFGRNSVPLFGGQGRRSKAPNARQRTLTAFLRPCSAAKGAEQGRRIGAILIFLIKTTTLHCDTIYMRLWS